MSNSDIDYKELYELTIIENKKLLNENEEKKIYIEKLTNEINHYKNIIQNNIKTNTNTTIEVKTVVIKDIIEKVLNSKCQNYINIVNDFMYQKPIMTNYFTIEKNTLMGKKRFISSFMDKPKGPSDLNFYEHINIVNLCLKCKVTLSSEQVELIEKVLK